MSEPLRVWIDQDLCTGDGLCEEICPDVFTLLDDGLAYVKEGGTIYAAAKRNPQGAVKAGTKKLKLTIKVRLDGEPASGEVLLRGEDVRKRVELDEKGRAVTRIGPFEDKGTQVVTVSYGDVSDTLRFKVR